MKTKLALLILFLAVFSFAEESKETRIAAAESLLSKLVTLAIQDGRLVVDQNQWRITAQKLRERKRAILAKELDIPPEKITERAIQNFDDIVDFDDLELDFDNFFALELGGYEARHSNDLFTIATWRDQKNDGDLEKDFRIKIELTTGARRSLAVEYEQKSGMKLELSDEKRFVKFSQDSDGHVALDVSIDGNANQYAARNFDALLRANPDKIQVNFLRPLADLGIAIPPSRFQPAIMATATSGYGRPDEQTQAKARQLLAKLESDDQETREAATLDLTKLFPLCIQFVVDAEKLAKDAETRLRLKRVISAHPGIAKARAYVEEKKLHNDKKYLLGIMAETPFFKAAARARLTVLFGKDYGDDPRAWPNE